MKKVESLQQFLYRNGIDKNTPKEKVERYKKAYRKGYKKFYDATVKKKRISITVSEKEYQKLEATAQKHQQKITSFVKTASMAYIDKKYVYPEKETMENLIVSLNRIGNNINQIAYHINSTGRTEMFYDDIRREFSALKKRVNHFLENPNAGKIEEKSDEIQG